MLFTTAQAFNLMSNLHRRTDMKNFTVALSLMLISFTTNAVDYCVTTSVELVAALSDAQNNGQDDHIRIRTGHYQTTGGVPFTYYHQEDHDLVVSGGWTSFNQIGCFLQQGDPLDTTLDGGGTNGVLYLQNDTTSSASLTISNMTINNGFTTQSNTGSGLEIYTVNNNFTGSVLVDQVLFMANHGVNGAGFWYIGSGAVTVRNSVFAYNSTDNGGGAAHLSMSAEADGVIFVNNTLIYNSSASTSPSAANVGGLLLNMNWNNGDTPDALIANNLFWYQDTFDFYVTFSGGNTMVYNNNYENGNGLTADTANNLSLPPNLEPQILNFTPAPGSPLNGKGLAMEHPLPLPTPFLDSWDHGTLDFDRGFTPRVAFGRVDIGAVEAPWEGPIFADGFD